MHFRGLIHPWLLCFYLGELVGNLWGVGVFAGFLFKRNNHEILKELSLLPLNELQLQCAVAGGPSKDGLQFQQPLGVSWGGKRTLIHIINSLSQSGNSMLFYVLVKFTFTERSCPKQQESITGSHYHSFLSLNLDMWWMLYGLLIIRAYGKCFSYNSVVGPDTQGHLLNTKLGSCCTRLRKNSSRESSELTEMSHLTLANERCGHSPLNLSSESLSLSLLSSGDRHETDKGFFYRSEGNFTNMCKNSMWVAETQIFTHLSGQWIKGIKRAFTSQRCSLNIGHGQFLQPLLPTFSAVNGVDPLDQL